jgi:hypothetical protein
MRPNRGGQPEGKARVKGSQVENPIYVFLFWELRSLSPNFHIHVSASDFYIPRISHIFGCSKIERPILETYIYLSDIQYESRNWETEHYNSALEIRRLHRFISGNKKMGTRHLYWILTGPSFAVQYIK